MRVVWVRSTHSPDSRVLKYQYAAAVGRFAWRAVRWNRSGRDFVTSDLIEIGVPGEIGGRWRNVLALIRWSIRLGKVLFTLRKQISHIHAVDLDSVLPCLLFAKLSGCKLIYEIYDDYADSRGLPAVIAQLVRSLERACVRLADAVILPDLCRLGQLGVSGTAGISIIENVPIDVPRLRQSSPSRGSFRLQLAYVGVLEPQSRGIEDLLAAVKASDDVALDIAGAGPLAELCSGASAGCENIRFHGPVSYQRALELMAAADVIVGLYYASNPNHKFAAPNKYFEHLMLGRALVTSAHTPPGERVSDADTGWAIADGPESLREWVGHATAAVAARKGHRARVLWESKYSTYQDTVVTPLYLRMIGIEAGQGSTKS